MPTQFTYNKAGVHVATLSDEITADPTLAAVPTACDFLRYNEADQAANDVEVNLTAPIGDPSPEKTALDAVITNHGGAAVPEGLGARGITSALSSNLSIPPGEPAVGDRHIVAEGGTGAWLGKDYHSAEWDGSAWGFVKALTGEKCHITDKKESIEWQASGKFITASGAAANFAAGAAPTAFDDTNAGFSVGSRWVDTSTLTHYVCVAAPAGAARWRQTDVHRYTAMFRLNGAITAQTKLDGAWIAPRSGTITRVTLYRRTAGSSGSTIVDVNINGTSIYTTQGNRPTVTQAAGNDAVDATTDMDVTTISADDRIEVDVDQAEAGTPQDLTVIVEVSYQT